MQVICTKATRAARVGRTSPSTPRGKSAFEVQRQPKNCCGSSVSQSLAALFGCGSFVVGYVDRYCGTTEVFFVLVVVVMLMAVQRIWRLRLGKLDAVETRWDIEWAWEVGEEPLTSPTVRATNRAIRMMWCSVRQPAILEA
jgi:hypothetical protein